MSAPTDYYPTLLQTLHQVTAYLSTTLAILPKHPRGTPGFLRSSVRNSLSHRLTCAEEIYKLRLFQDFRDEAALAAAISKLRDGFGEGSCPEKNWSTISDGEWEEEMEELRTLGESWILLLEGFSRRVEECRRSVM